MLNLTSWYFWVIFILIVFFILWLCLSNKTDVKVNLNPIYDIESLEFDTSALIKKWVVDTLPHPSTRDASAWSTRRGDHTCRSGRRGGSRSCSSDADASPRRRHAGW